MKTLYYSLVYPHLLYAIEVWGPAGITFLNRLVVLQKSIVRLLTYSDIRQNDYSFHSLNQLFFNEKLFKLHGIFKMSIAKFIYICLNKTCPVNVYPWFKLTTQIHSHNTRSQYIGIGNSITTNNLFIPSAKTSHYGLN